jgi:two-component system, OmpR family, sensor histidine kinase SaeS
MRLSHRLALVFSLFGALLTGLFQYQHVRSLKLESYASAERSNQVVLSSVKALLQAQARGDRPEFARNFLNIVENAGVASMVVQDGRGRRVLEWTDGTASLERPPHPGLPISDCRDHYHDLSTGVDLGVKGKGWVLLSFPTSALEARIGDIDADGVQNGLLAFSLISAMAWVMGVWLGLRVDQLVPAVESLPKDPEGFRPLRLAGSSDEVGRLAAAFNALGASLKQETQRRRELELEKRELSAMLVHDLKTPLTVIHSGITLLEEQFKNGNGTGDGKKPKKGGTTGRTFELLGMSTARLQRMVEDVLQLAKMEEVEGLRDPGPTDVAQLARACAKDFDLIAKDRGQRIEVKVPKEPALVTADAALIRRVLDNLVHNAIEHNPSEAAVTIKVARDGEHIRASVSDQGPGIPEEARSEIFRKFFNKRVKPHVGNVGLGLALCEKAIHRHGGTIGVEDAKPHGACFVFKLPARV